MSRLLHRVFPHQAKRTGRGLLPFADNSLNSIYTDGSIAERLERIQHHLRFSDSAAIISAPRGSGKTTLLNQIINGPTDDFICVHLQAGPDLEPADIESAILGANQPAAQSVAELTRVAKRAARLVLIAVDDAQALSQGSLHQLALWQTNYGGPSGALRLLLLTDDDSLGQRLGAVTPTETFALPPLSAEESYHYIFHRWRAALPQEPFPFGEQDIEEIHARSGGRPQLLNDVASKFLALQNQPVRRGNKPNRLLVPIIGGAILLVLIVAISSMFLNKSATQPQLRRAPIALPGTANPASRPALPAPEETSILQPAIPPAPAVPQPKPAPTAKPPSPLAEMLTQPDDSYTLQLVGSSSESAVQTFLAEHQLNSAFYFRSTRDNKAWYTAVLGVFPDRPAAIKALAELPKAVRDIPPWPRRIGDIKPIAHHP